VLTRAGFSDDVYEETERWRDRVTSTYQAVMRDIASLSVEMGRLASAALAFEATATLEQQIYRRRVFAVATWPGRRYAARAASVFAFDPDEAARNARCQFREL
jgi:hypothetical protein